MTSAVHHLTLTLSIPALLWARWRARGDILTEVQHHLTWPTPATLPRYRLDPITHAYIVELDVPIVLEEEA